MGLMRQQLPCSQSQLLQDTSRYHLVTIRCRRCTYAAAMGYTGHYLMDSSRFIAVTQPLEAVPHGLRGRIFILLPPDAIWDFGREPSQSSMVQFSRGWAHTA
jgi:hypothetical protein